MAPSVSMVMFSELSAVPMDASDSGVSSSDARGSKINISYVSSSLETEHTHMVMTGYYELYLNHFFSFIQAFRVFLLHSNLEFGQQIDQQALLGLMAVLTVDVQGSK